MRDGRFVSMAGTRSAATVLVPTSSWNEIPASLMGIERVSNQPAGSMDRSRRCIMPPQETATR